MKSFFIAIALMFVSFAGYSQASTLLASQAVPRDSIVSNFLWVNTANNRIYAGKLDSMRVKYLQMKWMKDTLTNRTLPLMKITTANDSMAVMRTRISQRLMKVDTASHWRGITWTPSWSDIRSKPSFASVASSGSYTDLSNLPTPITNNNQLINGSGYLVSVPAQSWTSITGKPSFSTVANTGAYSDLIGLPSIPSAQINSDWNAVSGLGQILNKPTIPTNTNQLTNGSGYISSVPAQSFSSLTGKPTTMAGYGITDGYTDTKARQALSITTTGNDLSAATYNNSTGVLNIPGRYTPTINSVTRTINSATFTPSPTLQAELNYYITITCTATIGGASSGSVVLQYSTNGGSTWINAGTLMNSNTVTLAVVLNSVTAQTACLSATVPPGALCRLVPTTAGSTVVSWVSGMEIY